ncbi:hypothetical protein DFQ09_102530 [Winogradskyella pacifica]|uniref:Uncharacterized protein n=1 Tax=Winogradskyella pacifica TaxID=664642 RepID=A0A3D9N2I1_9FLAO|nr:hypothetical protein DFQ09_102530 [Winogradskyella pacifica]
MSIACTSVVYIDYAVVPYLTFTLAVFYLYNVFI